MSEPFDSGAKRAIRSALARDTYRLDAVRIADCDVAGFDWLVATHKGLYAVSRITAKRIAFGWFFGICLSGEQLYVFENCGMRDRASRLGRIIRFDLAEARLAEPVVVVKGLGANCHQIEMIGGLLCVVDTLDQAILRFTPDGVPVDVKRPFAHAPAADTSGGYLHMNSIAKVGGRIAIMLHNGKAIPEKCSELAWLDSDWEVIERVPLDGQWCHDIVEDERGTVWHSASRTGEIMASDGRRAKVTEDRMTRGIAFSAGAMLVGLSSFGPRQNRAALPGAVAILDSELNVLAQFELDGPPADIVAI